MGKKAKGKALVVANSAENLMNYNLILATAFKTQNSPTLDSTLDLLDDFEPDIVVIDEKILSSSAIEIASAIRQDSIFQNYIGIVIIGDPKTKDPKNSLAKSQADLVIRHEDVGEHLLSSCQAALRIRRLESKNAALVHKLSLTKETVRELEGQDSISRAHNLPYLTILLEKEFQRTIRFNEAISVLVVSIDRFINISYTEGPKYCIKLIQQLAELLKIELRDEDILGRGWGGEFICVLPETDEEGAIVLAKRIKEIVVAQEFGPDSKRCTITVSQGIGSFNPMKGGKSDTQELLLEAEANLSEAKRIGINLICFHKQTA